MNEELRETLGKTLYNVSYMEFHHDWTMLTDRDKEEWMERAEKVTETYNAKSHMLIAIHPDLVRLNEINRHTHSASDEKLYHEFLEKKKRVEKQLEPFGYELQWNIAWQKFGIVVKGR